MRNFVSLSALLGFAFCAMTALPASAATPVAMQSLKACLSDETAQADRLAQCTSAIDSKQFRDRPLAGALTARGMVRGQQKNYVGAVADLDEAIRLSPDMAQAYWYRGGIYALTNDLERAVADNTKAVELAPKNPLVRRSLAYAYSLRKQYDRAIEELTTAISLAPRPYVEYMLRASTYVEMGEREKAIDDYKKSLEINPDYDVARKGLALMDANLSDEAVQLPGGRCSAENVPDEERATACEAVINEGKLSKGQIATAYCNLGYSLTELQQYDRVVESSDKAIALDPNSACAYLNRGRARYYKQDIDGAIADYTKTIALDSTFHEAYASRGTAYHERHDYAQAIANYDAAIGINSDNPMYFSDRGNSRFLSGDYKGAVKDETHALDMNPKYPTALIRRGYAYLNLNELANAETDFKRTLELAPGNKDAQNGLADIYDRQHKPEQAAAAREDAGGLNFNSFRRQLGADH